MGQCNVLLGHGVLGPGMQSDPDAVVVVLDVGMVVQLLRAIRDPVDERDGVHERRELELLEDLALLVAPPGEVGQGGADVVVGQAGHDRRSLSPWPEALACPRRSANGIRARSCCPSSGTRSAST